MKVGRVAVDGWSRVWSGSDGVETEHKCRMAWGPADEATGQGEMGKCYGVRASCGLQVGWQGWGGGESGGWGDGSLGFLGLRDGCG